MSLLLIPEDKLLDVPDEVLFEAAEAILQELGIDFDSHELLYSDEELDRRYQELLKIVERK